MRKFLNALPIIALLFFTFSFLYSSDHSFNQDLGRHLKLGEIISTSFSVPKTNLFSYTFPNFPFINHHWLFEVLIYNATVLIGLQGLLVIKVIIILFSAGLILLIAQRTQSFLFIPIAFLFLHMLRGRIELRPEIISFLFTAVSFYLLEKYEKSDTKLIYLLPIISLLWVNSHIYYPVGIFLQIIFLMHFSLQYLMKKKTNKEKLKRIKQLSIVVGLSLLALVINPNGLQGALYAFTVFNNYGVTIAENQTIATLQSTGFVNPDFLFFYLCLLVIGIAFMLALFLNKVTFKNVMILLLGVILAFQSIRGFPYLFFLSLPIVLFYLNFKKTNIWIKVLNGVVCLLMLIEAWYYLSGAYYNLTYRNHIPALVAVEDAKPALDFVISHKLPQPIFNNFDIGSYVLYRTYPTYKVFIDGRPEAYPASFFNNTYIPMQEDFAVYKRKEKQVGFKTVIFSITDQNPRTINFLRSMTVDPDWKLVYLDYYMVIFIRSDNRSLEAINLDSIDATNYQYDNVVAYTNLSTFLFNMNRFEQAKKINQKALDLAPQNPAANKVMANILLRDKHPNLAVIQRYLSKSENGIFW
jgi:hypothetical protein